MVTVKDYENGETAWCPGCGNFGILQAVKKALVKIDLEPYQVLMVSGIGQAAKLPHYMKCNFFNGLHGRTLPVATGAKIVNPKLTVIAVGGDGDGYSEGGNHFMHAIRRNIDVTYLVHDNQIYGLTKGQASATSAEGFVTKTTPMGAFSKPLNPIALAISQDISFVGRGFSGDIEHLSSLIAEAIENRGFSLVDILQPCVTFNRVNTYQWYRKRVYKLDSSYDPKDRSAAFKKAQEWGERIPIGKIYAQDRLTYLEHDPEIESNPVIEQKHDLENLKNILEDFKI
ncbi:MAG: 2-oxoacid:ferredoxin oxidoreductase subunit beta [Candidatus Bathyarchaeia archaeon]